MSATLYDGTTTVTLIVDRNYTVKQTPKIVVQDIPSRAGNVLQYMGRGSERITIAGMTISTTDRDKLAEWAKDGTSLTYTDVASSTMTVRLLSFSYTEISSKPLKYSYDFEMIEDE